MKDTKKFIQSIMAGVVAVSALAATQNSIAATKPATEKCYDIAKAGKNDCASGLLGCAGTAKQDGLGEAYLNVPKGLCDKIVGGSLTPIKDDSDTE